MINNDLTVVITVPVYKPQLTIAERASFLQLFSILSAHPIYIFTHEGIDMSEYEAIAKGHKFEITYFDKFFFKSIANYNRLLCNPIFYNRFKRFKYLLIYQFDAWVFSDELIKWCDADYDYIGAPWFLELRNHGELPPFLGIGNGGFSLRKIKSHLRVLHTFSYIIPAYDLFNQFLKKIGRIPLKKLISGLTFGNNTHFLLGKSNLNEDVFWSYVIKRNYKWFTAPDMITAAMFSMEENAELLFDKNGNKLPFGCHAWQKYDVKFWTSYIKISGMKTDALSANYPG